MLTFILVTCVSLTVWVAFTIFGFKKKWSKPISIAVGCLIAAFTFMFMIMVFMTTSSTPVSKEDARKSLIAQQFSAWDGSHKKLEAYVKNSMHDPQSYEHVRTRYWDRGDYIVVQTEFRGKNVFGGVVINHIKAKVGLNGDVMEILTVN